MTDMQIARTIVKQIQTSKIPNEPYLDFFKVVRSSQLVALDNGIQFRVEGDKFDGKIVIKLNGADLYDIELWDIRTNPDDFTLEEIENGTFPVVKKVDEIQDVYFDQLLEVLWSKIVDV